LPVELTVLQLLQICHAQVVESLASAGLVTGRGQALNDELHRQPLEIDEETYLPVYAQAWNEANNGGQLPLDRPAKNPALKGYLDKDDSKRQLPTGADTGWKDTVTCPSFTVTRIRVRWTPQDAVKFPFDAAQPPGYVWHCHMLEHEDNDMMRPIAPLPAPTPSP